VHTETKADQESTRDSKLIDRVVPIQMLTTNDPTAATVCAVVNAWTCRMVGRGTVCATQMQLLSCTVATTRTIGLTVQVDSD
jgi:hypothetical protein